MVRGTTWKVIAALVLCAGASTLHAQEADADQTRPAAAPSAGQLLLKAGTVSVAGARWKLEGPGRYVVCLDGPLTPARARVLADRGVTLLEYLPQYAWVARLDAAAAEQLPALGFVTWAGEFMTQWKISERLQAPHEGTPATNRPAEMLGVSLFPDSDPDAAAAALAEIPGVGIVRIGRSGGDLTVWVMASPDLAIEMARLADVSWIEPAPVFQTRNYSLRWVVQSNTSNYFPYYDAGLRGEGEIAGIIDTYISPTHCSFVDPLVPITEPGVYPTHRKIYAYNSPEISYDKHGTYVAATVTGDAGNNTAETRGVAYLSKLVFNLLPAVDETDVYNRFALHYSQGAFVHNNSWGNDGTSDYDSTARAVDNFSWTNPNNLLLFSVSNGTLIRNPENAKNCLAVSGSSDSPNQQNWCVGGAGPTLDGRRKPEVIAPACSVASSVGQNCTTQAQTGTSMACAAVSGAAILARQYYTRGYYPLGYAVDGRGFTPSGPLLKATIINAATDATGVSGYPSLLEGWGRVKLNQTLYLSGAARRLLVRDELGDNSWALQTGQTYQIPVSVTSSAEPLRITMAFHDAPASLYASYAPVNDLNLDVYAPNGTRYRGNNFSGGVSVAGGMNDAANNAEQVLINAPATGVWTIVISAAAVNTPNAQGFAVVASGAVAEGCPPDFDQSGFVDFDDYNQFVSAFVTGSAAADFNRSGFVDFDDFNDFVVAYSAGC